MDAGEKQKVWLLCTIMFRHEMGEDKIKVIDRYTKAVIAQCSQYKILYIGQIIQAFWNYNS